jgi:SdrD B-like domain
VFATSVAAPKKLARPTTLNRVRATARPRLFRDRRIDVRSARSGAFHKVRALSIAFGIFGLAVAIPAMGPRSAAAAKAPGVANGTGTTVIGDRIWADGNGNGVQDVGENGINGVTVRFVLGTKELASTISANNPTNGAPGWYQLSGLPHGINGKIVVDRVADYLPGGALVARVLSPTTAGTNRNRDSDATQPGYGFVQIEAVQTGSGAASAASTSYDIGFAPAAALIDQIWLDANSNGRHEAEEPGINGVGVSIYNAATNQLLGQTRSSADPADPTRLGVCFFDGLPPNVPWRIQLSDPADFAKGAPLDGLILTKAHVAGSTDSDDSDALLVGGVPTVAQVSSIGNYSLNVTGDFGFRALVKGEHRPPMMPLSTTTTTPGVSVVSTTALKSSAGSGDTPVALPAAVRTSSTLPGNNEVLLSVQRNAVNATSVPPFAVEPALAAPTDTKTKAKVGSRVIHDHSLILALTSDSVVPESPSPEPTPTATDAVSTDTQQAQVAVALNSTGTVVNSSAVGHVGGVAPVAKNQSSVPVAAFVLMALGLVGLLFARRLT